MFICGWCKQPLVPEMEDDVIKGVCVDCVDEYELELTYGQGEDEA